MRLFEDNIEREDRYAFNSESHYKYLNISAKPEFLATCEKLEDWFEYYPLKEKKEFIKRFRTDKDDQFLSAFFELYLYELLLKMGYTIEIHHAILNSNYKPDFFVKSNDGEEFYLEVITVTGKTKQEVAKEKLLNTIYDIISELRNRDFSLSVRTTSFPRKAIPATKIKQCLERELKNIDPDKCIQAISQNRIDLLPQWEFNHDGFNIEFSVLPRDKKYRDEINTQPIGIMTGPPKGDNSQKALMDSLRAKANKFAGLDRPFIIAVNVLEGFFDRYFFNNAFFGYQQDIYTKADLLLNELNNRVTGFWYSNGKCRYTRVSGILVATQLLPWTVGFTDLQLYHNPWARYSYSGKLNSLTYFTVDGNRYIKKDGCKPVKFLDVPERWPLYLAKEIF